MPPRERLFLLDGMALAYRAYFTFISRPLINSKGQNTSAIYGFVNTLLKILDEEKPEHIAVVFDTAEPTFRHKKFKEYKATRQKMPEDMAEQMDKLKEVVEAFNIPIIEVPGYEADDVMGTLAKRAEKEGVETYLVTGDKDFMQLLSSSVKLYKPGKKGDEWEIIGVEGVKEKFGVSPDKVIDVLGLTGDKSDNVPGIPGVGEKTAIPLVQKHGSIENILRNIDDIPQQGLREKLKEYKDKVLLSKELVTIDTNVPLNIDVHRLKASRRNIPKLIRLFTELEFKSLLKKLKEIAPQVDEDISFDVSQFAPTRDITTDKHQYHLVTTEKEFAQLVEKLSFANFFVFDAETTSLNPLQADIVGLSFCMEPRVGYYVPVKQKFGNWGKDVEEGLFAQRPTPSTQKAVSQRGFDLQKILSSLGPIFQNPKIKKCGQNVKYDMLALAQSGVWVEGIHFDTMVASYVLRADGQHNLDALALEYLNYKMISYDELTGTGKDRMNIQDVSSEKVAEYSAQDADITYRLYEILKKNLEEQKILKLCKEVEFPLISVLADMELTGVALDVDFLKAMSKDLERQLKNLVNEIYRFADEKFNVNSTQQLSEILFNRLKLPTARKTKTGFSTDVAVLESLRNEHPIIQQLIEYRQLSKLKSTYVDALPQLINPQTVRVHTSFNQTIAATGRLSSSDPNLQNIPMRSEIGREIRKAFIPGGKEMVIMSADYSQIELRVMAHISGDEGLIDAFEKGEDIHATTASKVFGAKPDEVTREMRRKAKEVNFGIMYGIGPFGLATRLEISQAEAKEIIKRYFERFPKVNQYVINTIAQAKHDGYVSTLLGRRRYLLEINSKNQTVRANAERQAINMPIQGSAADMIKIAMINIHEALRHKDSISKGSAQGRSKMILQVHDELVFEVPKEEIEEVKKLVVEEMKTALKLSVPIEVEVGTGKNWFEAH